eukprot:1692748-Pyramimonas_sp.AAC.1
MYTSGLSTCPAGQTTRGEGLLQQLQESEEWLKKALSVVSCLAAPPDSELHSASQLRGALEDCGVKFTSTKPAETLLNRQLLEHAAAKDWDALATAIDNVSQITEFSQGGRCCADIQKAAANKMIIEVCRGGQPSKGAAAAALADTSVDDVRHIVVSIWDKLQDSITDEAWKSDLCAFATVCAKNCDTDEHVVELQKAKDMLDTNTHSVYRKPLRMLPNGIALMAQVASLLDDIHTEANYIESFGKAFRAIQNVELTDLQKVRDNIVIPDSDKWINLHTASSQLHAASEATMNKCVEELNIAASMQQQLMDKVSKKVLVDASAAFASQEPPT